MKPLGKNTNEIACDLSRRLFIRNNSLATMGLLLASNIISCKKDETTEFSFFDALDFSGIDNFIDLLEASNNVEELSSDLQTTIDNYIIEIGITLTDDESAKNELSELLNFAYNNYHISTLEKTKLKNGEIDTFEEVVNRLTSIPNEISTNLNINPLSQSIIDKYFSKYLTKAKQSESDIEEFQYLNLAEELEQLRNNYTIRILEIIMDFYSNKSQYINIVAWYSKVWKFIKDLINLEIEGEFHWQFCGKVKIKVKI